MIVLDFDMLCASVALEAERRKGASTAAAVAREGGSGGAGDGVQRMWEGDVVLDCLGFLRDGGLDTELNEAFPLIGRPIAR